MKVQQEDSALQVAETAAVEAAAAAEELPEVERAVQLYVAQLQSVHAKRQRLLTDVVDKAEEILAGKIEREGAALKEVTGRFLRLEMEKFAGHKDGILSPCQLRIQGDAHPLDICFLWECDLLLPTLPQLKTAMRLCGTKGAVVLLVPAKPDLKVHSAVELGVAGLVLENVVSKRILLTSSLEDFWAVVLLQEAGLESDEKPETLAQRLWRSRNLIEKLPMLPKSEKNRLYPDSPTNRHFALGVQKGDQWWRRFLADLEIDQNGVALVQPDPEVGEVMEIARTWVKEGGSEQSLPLGKIAGCHRKTFLIRENFATRWIC